MTVIRNIGHPRSSWKTSTMPIAHLYYFPVHNISRGWLKYSKFTNNVYMKPELICNEAPAKIIFGKLQVGKCKGNSS